MPGLTRFSLTKGRDLPMTGTLWSKYRVQYEHLKATFPLISPCLLRQAGQA